MGGHIANTITILGLFSWIGKYSATPRTSMRIDGFAIKKISVLAPPTGPALVGTKLL